jgi:hypothetical protein
MPCYQDWEYEYEDDGSYGNEYEYEDHAEYDHGDPDPEPPPSEPDINEPEYGDATHTFEDEGPGTEQAHWEGGHEGEVEGYELEDEGSEVDELRELEYEGDQVHEHGELICDDDDKMRELKELERMIDEEGYEPQGPDFGYEETQEPPQCAYELEHKLEYSNDWASKYEDHEDGNGYTYPHHLPPVSTACDDHNPHMTTHYPTTYVHPSPLPFTPTPIPLARDSPHSNQRRHVTASENHAPLFNNEHDDDERKFANVHNDTVKHLADYPTAAPASHYTYLDTLRHDYHNGITSTVTYMQDLQEYTEGCLHEHAEWKADERAEIRQNHNIAYPKRDYLVRP